MESDFQLIIHLYGSKESSDGVIEIYPRPALVTMVTKNWNVTTKLA